MIEVDVRGSFHGLGEMKDFVYLIRTKCNNYAGTVTEGSLRAHKYTIAYRTE